MQIPVADLFLFQRRNLAIRGGRVVSLLVSLALKKPNATLMDESTLLGSSFKASVQSATAQ